MAYKTEKTAPKISVGADKEQPSQKCTANIITTEDENFKSFEEIQREMIRMMDPSYLKTVSMTELYDTVYQSKPAGETSPCWGVVRRQRGNAPHPLGEPTTSLQPKC